MRACELENYVGEGEGLEWIIECYNDSRKIESCYRITGHSPGGNKSSGKLCWIGIKGKFNQRTRMTTDAYDRMWYYSIRNFPSKCEYFPVFF